MKIRKAKKENFKKIMELNHGLTEYHSKIDDYYVDAKENAKRFKKHLDEIAKKKNFCILVAEDKNEVVGFLVGRVDKPRAYAKPKKIGMLSTAFVEAKVRRSGIGEKLFKEFLAFCKKNKVKNIELSVDCRNLIGQGAWKKFGFKDFMKRMRMDL